jgi:DNA-binding GntR family transcriptional regulator
MTEPRRGKKPLELPSSRRDLVAEALRESILTGERPAGSRINLDEVAQDFGVSRMPVREALMQLATEGLVTTYPHRGVEVSQLDVADVEEIFGIGLLLEQGAAERAIPRLTNAEFDDMLSTLERMDQLVGRGKTWIELNRKFHRTVNAASGWPRLVSMIEMLDANVERYVRAYVEMVGYSLPQKQHWALYKACRARDIERAKAVISEHFQDTAKQLVAELKKRANGAEQSAISERSASRGQRSRTKPGISGKAGEDTKDSR